MSNIRVPVLSPDGKPLMPTTASRARRWVNQSKATGQWSDIGVYYVQLLSEPSGYDVQEIVVGVDPGKQYSGIGIQSARFTLLTAHLVLPFQKVRERMQQRAMMRRTRRGRRINRKVPFAIRAHRQKRFDNRRGNKLPPSIRANRQLELRVVSEICKLYPVSSIVYEIVKANGSKSFSPVMVGQKWMLKQLEGFTPVASLEGWQTAQIRSQLGLVKDKANKAKQSPDTHAVDGIALAASHFVRYQKYHKGGEDGAQWTGSVAVTESLFKVIRRPPVSRRQLHLMIPAKGGGRRKYGGTTTPFNIRKGDLVKYKETFGYCSGYTGKQVSVSNAFWQRLGRYAASKVSLVCRSNGLVVSGVSNPVQPPLLSPITANRSTDVAGVPRRF
jgi:RRXRR protein